METEESIKKLISRESYPLKTPLLFLASLANSSINTCSNILLRACLKLDNSKHTQKSCKANWQVWVRNHCLITNNLSAMLKLFHLTPLWTLQQYILPYYWAYYHSNIIILLPFEVERGKANQNSISWTNLSQNSPVVNTQRVCTNVLYL